MTIELPESLPRLNADERKLKQVLLNLMSNAIKFTPEGGRVALTARRAGDGSFVFEVSDPGTGIAPADIDRKRVGWGKSVAVSVDYGGGRRIKKKTPNQY